ncbi:MAG: hypothetical protein ACHQ9S_00865 [Candidatus Binatia bacterium]
MEPNQNVFERGAVAVLDALGFKGIWERVSPDVVLKNLQILAAGLERLESINAVGKLERHGSAGTEVPGDAVHVRNSLKAFSDTIVITTTLDVSATAPKEFVQFFTPFRDLATVINACELISVVLGAAATEIEAPLLYRGALTFGEFLSARQFLIGPAIDEAAPAERLAEAAMVWLCPRAREIIDEAELRTGRIEDDGQGGLALVRDYPVPLKEGRFLKTHVVNPLLRTPKLPEAVAQDMMAAFGSTDDPAVIVKRQNTETFLKHALAMAKTDPLRRRLFDA